MTQKIHQEVTNDSGDGKTRAATPRPKLIPKKGTLYTYRLIAPDSVHREEGLRLWIDLGFQVQRQMPKGSKGFEADTVVESVKREDGYSLQKTSRNKESLYTYKASVERVVDADTFLVKIDLGFETRIRQYLRLRGIDAAEISTPEGKRAVGFVKRKLGEIAEIILTSSRSDKYDRYLADVFYEKKGEEVYLNQLLLDEGFAVRI